MRDRPSKTAALVAACRTLGAGLPEEARLALDPYGAAFAGRGAELVARYAPRVAAVAMRPAVLYMQVRTRAIDDVLRRFLADGGRQVLLLGAGYDCRALRFADALDGARFFEVDHPATQAHKRAVLDRAGGGSAAVTYVEWNFESRPVGELPDALAALGHDPTQPTLTIWEGVTMYLTEPAIEASVAAVHALSSPGSPFVITYFDRARFAKPGLLLKLLGRLVARSGEPFRFGWSPTELPAWLAARSFSLSWDRATSELARELMPARYARSSGQHDSHIAVAQRDRAASPA